MPSQKRHNGCHVFTTTEAAPEGYYQTVFVPLPAEIAELIPMA